MLYLADARSRMDAQNYTGTQLQLALETIDGKVLSRALQVWLNSMPCNVWSNDQLFLTIKTWHTLMLDKTFSTRSSLRTHSQTYLRVDLETTIQETVASHDSLKERGGQRVNSQVDSSVIRDL